MKELLFVVYLVTVFSAFPLMGWYLNESLNYQVAARQATIDNLMVSLRQARDKPPEIQTVVVEKPIEKIVYETKTVYLDRPVEITKYPEWKTFNTIEDFPKVSIAGLSPDNCLPMAQALQEMLLNQGFITSVAVAWNGYYDNIYVTSAPGAHAGLLVETKKGWYFIDPTNWQTTLLFKK